MLTRAFQQAAGQLRPEVSIDAEVIGLLGMLPMLATWRSRHWADLSDQQVADLLTARLRPLLRTRRARPGRRSPAGAATSSPHA